MSARGRPLFSLAGVLIALCCLLACFAGAGVYFIQTHQREALVNQAATVSLDALNAFTGEMDKAFENIENYVHELFYNNRDIDVLSRYESEASRFQSRQGVLRVLDHIVRLSGMVECAWIYSPTGNDAEYLARSAYTGISNAELLRIRERIIAIIDGGSGDGFINNYRWAVISTGDVDYLLWMTSTGETFYGAWVRLTSIHERFKDAFSLHNINALILSRRDGTMLIGSDIAGQEFYLVPEDKVWAAFDKNNIGVTSYFTQSDLAVTAILPRDGILSEMSIGIDFATFAAGMSVIILLIVLAYQLLMYRPFFRLDRTLQKIAGGDLSIRFSKYSRLKEINTLERSVNHLLDVISDLKINMYETQLQQRNVSMQYLRIRLQTHFYLNCLSIIHALACVSKTDLIKEMAYTLSQYLRFLDNDNEFVRLEDELSHTRNYARIQEMRFPDMFEYTEDVALELYNISIPPLILQTFIENSVEHAMLHGKKNWVCLRADYEDRGELPGIRLRVTDSGKGFNDEVLGALADGTVAPDLSDKGSIGIQNVIRRLALIYEGRASIMFSNAQGGGAQIDMWLPVS